MKERIAHPDWPEWMDEKSVYGPWNKAYIGYKKNPSRRGWLYKRHKQLINEDLEKKLKAKLDNNTSFEFIDFFKGDITFRRIIRGKDNGNGYAVYVQFAHAPDTHNPFKDDGSPLLEDFDNEREIPPWGLHEDYDISSPETDYDDEERAEVKEINIKVLLNLIESFYKKDGSLPALNRFLNE